ncbi:hypothetical protein CEUSTIGMA_g7108.t1 [Chlamydomonas eustigma]|uniref:Uncharacterized protein n=1 Tax=Chlamydomonas eustigma TaxID=1157962 RepID=A0A250X9D3_9CHLO|nr:hypothetical protein CEUSTIGMA_g7108.t1 [Chlamydomonas eustigma]|eukprot:GAX79667.1 hypothetical protein CEUSTIGMA_g7108.t1 [Chlamydomonas eustigma]
MSKVGVELVLDLWVHEPTNIVCDASNAHNSSQSFKFVDATNLPTRVGRRRRDNAKLDRKPWLPTASSANLYAAAYRDVLQCTLPLELTWPVRNLIDTAPNLLKPPENVGHTLSCQIRDSVLPDLLAPPTPTCGQPHSCTPSGQWSSTPRRSAEQPSIQISSALGLKEEIGHEVRTADQLLTDSSTSSMSLQEQLKRSVRHMGSQLQLDLFLNPRHREHMLSVALNLLKHTVGQGWCIVSTRIMKEVLEVYDMSFEELLDRFKSSEDVPLLHLAIQARRIQILHTVLGWGDLHGYRWKWKELAPSQDGLSLSCLHVAAALDDGGYAAELILLKYDEARDAWHSVHDNYGQPPSAYANKFGKLHLQAIASECVLGKSNAGDRSLNLQSMSSESLGSSYYKFSNDLESQLSGLLSVKLRGLDNALTCPGTDMKRNEIG